MKANITVLNVLTLVHLGPRGPVHVKVGSASRCPFRPQQCLGCHPAPKPASLSSMASPPACLATLLYVLFYFLWFLPLRPAIVAHWTTPDGARVSKNIGTSFCSPLPIAPRARGHEPGSFVSQQVGEDRSPGGRGYRCWFCSWRLQLLAHGGFQRLGCCWALSPSSPSASSLQAQPCLPQAELPLLPAWSLTGLQGVCRVDEPWAGIQGPECRTQLCAEPPCPFLAQKV